MGLMKLCCCIRLLHVTSPVALPLSNNILPVCSLGLGRRPNLICPIQSKSLFLASKPSVSVICEFTGAQTSAWPGYWLQLLQYVFETPSPCLRHLVWRPPWWACHSRVLGPFLLGFPLAWVCSPFSPAISSQGSGQCFIIHPRLGPDQVPKAVSRVSWGICPGTALEEEP